MNRNPSGYWTVSLKQLPVLVLDGLFLYPLWLYLHSLTRVDTPESVWLAALFLTMTAGMLLRGLCRRRWRQLLAAPLLGLTGGLLVIGWNPWLLLFAAAGMVCGFLGLTSDSTASRDKRYIIGLGLYAVAALASSRIEAFEDHMPWITGLGSFCLLVYLLIRNGTYLRYSSFSSDSRRLPQGLRQHNRIFMVVLVAAAAFLAAGGGRAAGHLLFQMIRAFVGFVLHMFDGSPPRAMEEPPKSAPPEDMPPAPSGESGLFGLIADMVFYALGAAVLGFLLFHLTRWLYRNSRGWFRAFADRLLAMLLRESKERTTAYQDEESSIFRWEKTVKDITAYVKSKWGSSARDRWEDMHGGREQARWLYRRWLGRRQASGYSVNRALTPQETAADAQRWLGDGKPRKGKAEDAGAARRMLELYYQARYGPEEPSSSEAAALKEKLE